jgi:hypothetical protein
MDIINTLNNIIEQAYNNRTLAKELYEKGFLPNKNYFNYEYNKFIEFDKEKEFRNNFRNNFSERLGGLKINEKEFLNSLKMIDGVISGSFILQCIIGEKWSSDIDIYVKKNSTSRNLKKIYLDFNSSMNKIELINDYLRDDKNDDFNFGLQKLLLNDVNVDLIFINEDCGHFINNQFDFDFCKNYYDGRELYIYNIESIINRYCYTKLHKFFDIRAKVKLTKDKYYICMKGEIKNYEPSEFQDMEYVFHDSQNMGYWKIENVNDESINIEEKKEEDKEEQDERKLIVKEFIRYENNIRIKFDIVCYENINMTLRRTFDKLYIRDVKQKNIQIEINETYLKRMEKYKERGFKIFIDLIHDENNYDVLLMSDIKKNINKKYFEIHKKEVNLSQEVYDTICNLFKENKEESKEFIKFTDNEKIYKFNKNKISKYKNSYLYLLISNDNFKIEKNKDNIIIEKNSEFLYDIYENGIEKYFNKIMYDEDFKDLIKFYGFIPSKEYDYYVSQNMFSVNIINAELEKLGIKDILENIGNYYIVGSFIDHCLFGTDFQKIKIYLETGKSIEKRFTHKLNHILDINYFTDPLKRIFSSEYGYYFDGKLIRKVNYF